MPLKDVDKRRAYNKKWRESNKEKKATYDKQWYNSNIDRKAFTNKIWYSNNIAHCNLVSKRWTAANPKSDEAKQRSSVEEHRRRAYVDASLGNMCSECNSTGPAGWLHVDHINTDGYKDGKRKAWKNAFLYIEKYGVGEALKKYQLLCPNCHAIKTLSELKKIQQPAWVFGNTKP